MSTHRKLSRMTALWLLGQRWAWMACDEISVGTAGRVDAMACSKPVDEAADDLSESRWDGALDRHRVMMDLWQKKSEGEQPRPVFTLEWSGSGKLTQSRVAIAEVKRTRGDLLADLRARKMLGYEPAATHCYLAVHEAALRPLGDPGELGALGLPSHWGVLILNDDGVVACRRGARRLRAPEAAELRIRCFQIGRALSYRTLRAMESS